jgi:hypothetical protein
MNPCHKYAQANVAWKIGGLSDIYSLERIHWLRLRLSLPRLVWARAESVLLDRTAAR